MRKEKDNSNFQFTYFISTSITFTFIFIFKTHTTKSQTNKSIWDQSQLNHLTTKFYNGEFPFWLKTKILSTLHNHISETENDFREQLRGITSPRSH